MGNMRPLRSSLLTWLTVLILSAASFVQADRVFFARSVSYCSQSRAIEVKKFLFAYNADQQTISFDVDAGQVDPDLRAIIQIELEAYGIVAINTTLNLCDVLLGVLCPLPVYDFVASATLPLPSVVAQDIDIPGIGFIVPDLEAQATIRLLNVDDLTEAVCLNVKLSNGKSVRYTGISWALAGIVIGAVALGLVRGLVALVKKDEIGFETGRQKERVLEIMSWLQFCAATGLLSIDYPLLFQSWTANFAWSLFLEPRISSIQNEIYDMRNRTGGNLTQLAGTIVGGEEAQTRTILSGLNVESPPASDLVQTLATTLLVNLASSARTSATGLFKRQLLDGVLGGGGGLGVPGMGETDPTLDAAREVIVPEVQETDVVNRVPTGIARYVVALNISPFNSFMTVFFNFLLLICVFLALCLLLAVPFWLLTKRSKRNYLNEKPTSVDEKGRWADRSQTKNGNRMLVDVVRANALRLLLIAWFPLLIFIFFQWRLGSQDAWSPIVLSVFTFLFTTGAVLGLAGITLLTFRRQRRQFDQAGHGTAIGGPNAPFYNTYKDSRYWFFVPVLFGIFARAVFISFAQYYGWVESIALVVIEVATLVIMCFFVPFNDKSSNGMQIILQILRCIICGALIAFNRSIGLNEIARTAVGAVLAVIQAVVVVFLFILLMIDVVSLLLYLIRGPRPKTPRTWYGKRIRPNQVNEGSTIGGEGLSSNTGPEMANAHSSYPYGAYGQLSTPTAAGVVMRDETISNSSTLNNGGASGVQSNADATGNLTSRKSVETGSRFKESFDEQRPINAV
ncbi:hypothetical protein OIO90_001696 [Microbotryomycetes sp. JL221]|nr:hypothetical protein OIO90_001696 [Microbotryomycetes sp. JL221]